MPRPPANIIQKVCEMCNIQYNVTDTKRNKNRRFCSGTCAKRNTGLQNKGKTHSEEINKKKGLSGNSNPFYGKSHSKSTKDKLRSRLAGKSWEEVYGEELAAEMRENASRKNAGSNNPFHGKLYKKESKNKMGRDVSGIKNPMFGKGYLLSGEKNGSWNGGQFTKELKTEVRKRDCFTCAVCRKKGWVVHHIDYNKLNNDKKNLITLCSSCHGKTNFNRDSWQSFFVTHMESMLNE
jgi:hypothetical protein